MIYGCPAVGPGFVCLHSYPTGITVVTDRVHFVTSLNKDQDGNFEILLEPGEYSLIPAGVGGSVPSAGVITVHVDANRFTPVSIVYDSGIR